MAAPIDPDDYFASADEAESRTSGLNLAANDAGPSRVPPHNLEAEAQIVGTVLYDADRLCEIADLATDHLYSESYRRILEAVRAIQSAGRPVDLVVVAEALKAAGRLAQVGGTPTLVELIGGAAVPTARQLAEYVRIVREAALTRQTIAIGHRLALEGFSGIDATSSIASAVADLAKLASSMPSARLLLDGAALAAPLPEIEHLVREIGLVAGGGAPHLLAGYGFTGKTVAAQALALSLASGGSLWGAYRVRPARVVHVDMEQGDRLTRRRYQRLALASGIDLASLGDALSVSIMPPIGLVAGDASRWRELMAGRALIIIDSLRAATGGQDENSSDIRAGLDMLGSLSEATGCRALVIHHARKPSADEQTDARFAIRGSSAIFDACDSVYLFSAKKGEPVRVEHAKARSHGEPVEDVALVVADVEIGGDPHGGLRVQVHGAELVAQRREEHATEQRKSRVGADAQVVRRVLASNPGLGTRQLRAAVRSAGGFGNDRCDDAIAALGNAVEIRDEVNGRSRLARHYLRGSI